MNVLVTGAKGFAGKNLVESLKNVQSGKDRTRDISIDEIFEYDVENSFSELDEFCEKADFVFSFAGINRPKEQSEFMAGNRDFITELLSMLKKHGNFCPVMFASSIQASLEGKYSGSEYGKSKLAGEEAVFEHGKETGAETFVYRFPNLFGKWSRPDYNSVIATFCSNVAKDLPIKINDPETELELLYIDDLVDEMLNIPKNGANRCEYREGKVVSAREGKYCFVPKTHKATLGRIAELLYCFKNGAENSLMPEIPEGSFEKKLYSTYLSFLPAEKAVFDLKMNCDDRGSFTEFMKTEKCGQFSINVSKPGITKGQHWHHTKWEFFIVVAGHGLIQQRKIGTDEVLNFEVSGEKIRAVHMLPGYTHNIINLSETENLVTVMWANEQFEPNHPDTFFEIVE